MNIMMQWLRRLEVWIHECDQKRVHSITNTYNGE